MHRRQIRWVPDNLQNPSGQQVSTEKQYDYITTRLSELGLGVHNTSKIFISGFTAIIGGSIWLSLHLPAPKPLQLMHFEILSTTAVFMLARYCVTTIEGGVKAWEAHRDVLTDLTQFSGFPAPERNANATNLEKTTANLMKVATVVFAVFNPFSMLM